MQLGTPNMTYKCSTVSCRNSLVSGQTVKGQIHVLQKNIADVGFCTLVSAGIF